MFSIDEIVERMRNALTLSDPSWDVHVGTPEHKIIEAVAQEIQRTASQGLISSFHFDIETKMGAELDDFVGMFGITRLPGRRATGTVKFSRGAPAEQDYFIPANTQVYRVATSLVPAIYFQTVSAATLSAGLLEVEVPIEAVVAGSSGNTTAGSITGLGSNPGGVTSVINEVPTTGGQDPESDAQLRTRWKATVFRNLAGTEDQFLGLVLDDPDVSRANVIGPLERWREQLEVLAGDPPYAESTISGSKYTYPAGGEFVGHDLDTIGEEIAIRGTDYTFTPSVPPVVEILNEVDYPVGSVLEVEHEYCPAVSRNDPANGLTHMIDIYVSGQRAQMVYEDVTFPSSTFQDDNPSNDFYVSNWRRTDGSTHPTAGNYFVPLFRTPIVALPATITVGTDTYELGTDYWLVRDITLNKNSPRARDGIEWSANSAPDPGDSVTIDYYFNRMIHELTEAVETLRLVGFDVLVHRADYTYLRVHLSIVHDFGANEQAVADAVSDALTQFLEEKGFSNNVQAADMIEVIMGVDGVDNVRLTTSDEDPTNYGIQKLAEDGTLLSTHATDLYLEADELPVLDSVVVTSRGVNSF